MQLPAGKKVYFLSDFHLGAPNFEASLVREKKLVAFLDSIKDSAAALFIVGDMFDFWFEYRHVVPRGYTRILGKLAEMGDKGVQLHFFAGNHDMWLKNYFQQEIGMAVNFESNTYEFNGKKFFVAHGDGLGPGDKSYKFLKKIFRNPVCQFLFGILPPAIGFGLARFFSRKSREKVAEKDAIFLGEDKELLIVYSKTMQAKMHFDYYIFGHRHLPMTFDVGNGSQYVNLGDWITHFTYAVFENDHLTLEKLP